ncbi:6789_t:CDS:2, partial [Acaulospora colombiana]
MDELCLYRVRSSLAARDTVPICTTILYAEQWNRILNVIFFAQQLPPSGSGVSLSIPNLTLGGWATLMVFATVSSQLPFAFLFLAIVNVLQSRWYAFVQETTGSKVVPVSPSSPKKSTKADDQTLHKFPAFLGWKGKEGASFFIAFILVFLTLVSKLTMAIGLKMVSDDHDKPAVLNQYNTIVKTVTFFDGVVSAFVAIAVMDVSASSFCLKRAMKREGYMDSTVITSSFHTIGNPDQVTLAKVDLAALVITLFMVAFSIILLLSLYRSPSRWNLWRPGGDRVAIRMDTLNDPRTPQARDIDDDAASEITLTPDIVPPPRVPSIQMLWGRIHLRSSRCGFHSTWLQDTFYFQYLLSPLFSSRKGLQLLSIFASQEYLLAYAHAPCTSRAILVHQYAGNSAYTDYISLYSGKQLGPEPPFNLCLVQGSLYYGTLPLAATSSLAIVYQVWSTVYPFAPKDNTVTRIWQTLRPVVLLGGPWISWLFWATAAAWTIPQHPSKLSRNR